MCVNRNIHHKVLCMSVRCVSQGIYEEDYVFSWTDSAVSLTKQLTRRFSLKIQAKVINLFLNGTSVQQRSDLLILITFETCIMYNSPDSQLVFQMSVLMVHLLHQYYVGHCPSSEIWLIHTTTWLYSRLQVAITLTSFSFLHFKISRDGWNRIRDHIPLLCWT
jgi:hypothetical protein